MIKNQALADILRTHGATLAPTNERFHVRIPARSVAKLLDGSEALLESFTKLLGDQFLAIESTLGAYPHSAVKASAHVPRDSAAPKVECIKTGYKARIATAWLKKYGAPKCPCCNILMMIEVAS